MCAARLSIRPPVTGRRDTWPRLRRPRLGDEACRAPLTTAAEHPGHVWNALVFVGNSLATIAAVLRTIQPLITRRRDDFFLAFRWQPLDDEAYRAAMNTVTGRRNKRARLPQPLLGDDMYHAVFDTAAGYQAT